ALSSRNARLDAEARAKAPALHAAMQRAAGEIRAGGTVDHALAQARTAVLAGGFDTVEYIDLRSAALLEPMPRLTGPARLLAAAVIGGVRLIDNIAV
ncbi:MAG: pantoate--beta-alanine ligase, partial [Paracoccaceae bacterium]|nr:pantoate--beta-alanine ligase [Paracoccaceae bacterium]